MILVGKCSNQVIIIRIVNDPIGTKEGAARGSSDFAFPIGLNFYAGKS